MSPFPGTLGGFTDDDLASLDVPAPSMRDVERAFIVHRPKPKPGTDAAKATDLLDQLVGETQEVQEATLTEHPELGGLVIQAARRELGDFDMVVPRKWTPGIPPRSFFANCMPLMRAAHARDADEFERAWAALNPLEHRAVVDVIERRTP